MPKCNGVTLEEATIDQLQDAMNTGQLTTQQIVLCYMQRIYQTDMYLKAIMELNPDFMQIASVLDAERAAGHIRGPLHGIPFLVKDNIATKDKMETTAGSWALLGSLVPRDAHVVDRLRREGALLLGHATLSEWADMRSSVYSEGYSARGEQARGPYNLSMNPGGSSSGSGAAVAANLFISPAERNALVGIKPTVGLTSRAGYAFYISLLQWGLIIDIRASVIPESSHQDTVGVLARTVRDAVYSLDGMYGLDPRDNYTSAQEGKTPTGGYTQFLANKTALQGATFGLPWNSFWVYAEEPMLSSLLELLELIKRAGATIINGTELPNYQKIVSPNGWNWDYGTTRGFANESEFTVVKISGRYRKVFLSWCYKAVFLSTDLEHLMDFFPRYNNDNIGTEGGTPNVHPAFASGQDDFLASLESKGVMDETYYQALAFCQKSSREDGIDAALHHDGIQLSALLVPPEVGQTYQIAAQAGYPVLTVPAGINTRNGLPFGLALMNTAWSEPTLIKYASAIEDLQFTTNTVLKRTLPTWYGYRQRIIPVL
ncbi:hypothetical protein MMC07_002727 [Pseudocyphellaria aurata]|nr:hypothetical protein [Pseudocyphellaria aurata]